MIRLAFVIDKQDVISHANNQENRERIEALPDGVMEQITKVSQKSHFIVGRNSYGLYTSSEFTEQHKLYVLSKDPEFQVSQTGVEIERDHRVLVERFMTSKETVTVFGGGEVLSLFFPYAKEMRVIMLDQKLEGDIVFSDWKENLFDLIKSERWEHGTTYYYVKA